MVAAAEAAGAGVVPNPANGETVGAAGADVAVDAAPNPPKGFAGADVAGAAPSL